MPAVVVILYVALSIPGVQNLIRDKAEKELTALLGTRVEIEEVNIAPFNRVLVKGVTVCDDRGAEALHIDHLGAGISLSDLFVRKKFVISYAELIGFRLDVNRDSASAPLNIAPIIERLKGRESGGKKSFDLAVTTVVIRHGEIRYDVLDRDTLPEGMFDPDHLAVTDFRADIKIPAIASDRIAVDVKRMAATERSGFRLRNLRLNFETGPGLTRITDMALELGSTYLAFNDITASFSLLDLNTSELGNQDVEFSTLAGSVISPSDFSPFAPELSDLDLRVSTDIDISGRMDSISVSRFELGSDDGLFSLLAHGRVENLIDHSNPLSVTLDRMNLAVNGGWLDDVLCRIDVAAPVADRMLRNSGDIDLLTYLTFTTEPMALTADGTLMCDAGSIDLAGKLERQSRNSAFLLTARVETTHFDPSAVFGQDVPLTDLSFTTDADCVIAGLNSEGAVDIHIPDLRWRGFELGGLTVSGNMSGRNLNAEVTSRSRLMNFSLAGDCDFRSSAPSARFRVEVDTLSTAPFVAKGRFADNLLSLVIDGDLSGRRADDIEGWLKISDFNINDRSAGKRLRIDDLTIESVIDDSIRCYTLTSDFLDGKIAGRFLPTGIASTVRNIFYDVYPALASSHTAPLCDSDELTCEFTLKPDSVITRYFSLPVEVIHPVKASGLISSPQKLISLTFDAPYILQKDKLIEKSAVHLAIDGESRKSDLFLTTLLPTKHGPMTLSVTSDGGMNSTDTEISWNVKRESDYHGDFRFTTTFDRDSTDTDRPLVTRVDVNRSTMIFNDTAWTVSPSRIDIRKQFVNVDNFHAGREGQHIIINGGASADSTDFIRLQLLDIDLDYVFETLNINNVMFGGNATGDFFASGLFSKSPILYTDNLSVKDLSYNGCVMGDGAIRSAWHNSDQAVSIYADITQSDGLHSIIDGAIRPLAEELDFKFYADRARVGFLLPFMSAFASDVSGFATGFAHLYGTFKLIDLTGDILAEDLKMKLIFTNTEYSVERDSVHITPGVINFNDVTIKDIYGATALLSGQVRHKCFKEPEFKFDITDAGDFLCYDVSEQQTTDPWYGRIFGNGGASVNGYPGMVDISVRMSTAPRSTFTFVLSDAEQATEYTFITFHDRDKARKDSIASLDPTVAIINDVRARRKVEEQGPPTDYVMDFDIDVTPAATLNLVMDPVGGDKIRANGKGHIRMNYASTGDLKMFGEYQLDRGSYNFTLQDIIIKDFTIEEGSMIKFNGNPYAALLDIKAAYTVNANLTDLDESFSQDKELNRTNVPVNAMLLVTGDMRQPDIKFDLRFPTLTLDVDRKVRSIVSTDDMMNRQIIYLLALNRFYTPDYMNATRGNELVSVASSTISSQLSSMLGQLSDKWSISPNFRSDRGDFSDVEVDVALSSHLLNNRLLLNGNFGYRDKSLNNNSFIGDFDIRYLLNRSGSISLKAYNRYNDQNYYLKSALTTQGVGVVFKRDFDNIFAFLRPLFRKKKSAAEPSVSPAAANDSIMNDSIVPAHIPPEHP